mgnify:CR=1 FL=1
MLELGSEKLLLPLMASSHEPLLSLYIHLMASIELTPVDALMNTDVPEQILPTDAVGT